MTYLILHKVRGKPALDIAERGCVDTKPCQPDCGGYNHDTGECKFENDFTISTSGHAAKPFMSWPITEIPDNIVDFLSTDIPADWPDHYSVNDKPAGKGQSSGLNLMDFIKMPQEKVRLRRRL